MRFVKINNRSDRDRKRTAGVFFSFCVPAPANVLAQTNLIYQSPFAFR